MEDKLVDAGASLLLVFLIGKLKDLISSYLKLFEIFIFLISSAILSVPKTFKKFANK